MENIRENLRQVKYENRIRGRDKIIAKTRQIDVGEVVIEITEPDDAIRFAKTIQRKSAVTPEMLTSIRNSLLEHPHLISSFLSIESTLCSLLRILNGPNATMQLLAAECLCNISLSCGDKSAGNIAKTFGAYFLIYFDSYFAEVCLWTVGNLSCHQNSIQVFEKQGIYDKVLNLLNSEIEEVVAAAEYCLKFYLLHNYDRLSDDFIKEVMMKIRFERSPTQDFLLILSLLSGKAVFQKIMTEHRGYFKLLETLETSQTSSVTILCIRILANLAAEPSGICAEDILRKLPLESLLNQLPTNLVIKKEFFWLLGNFLFHSSAEVRNETQRLLSTIQINF